MQECKLLDDEMMTVTKRFFAQVVIYMHGNPDAATMKTCDASAVANKSAFIRQAYEQLRVTPLV